jgi:hypothetical protein
VGDRIIFKKAIDDDKRLDHLSIRQSTILFLIIE